VHISIYISICLTPHPLTHPLTQSITLPRPISIHHLVAPPTDELIDVPYEENDTKMIRFAKYLQLVFQQPDDSSALLQKAAETLGHLGRAGGTLVAEIIEHEIERALRWLEIEKKEQRSHAAVLVLRNLATNTPSIFSPFVERFLDHIWIAMGHARLPIREAAAEALRACLILIGRRDDYRWRSSFYLAIFNNAHEALSGQVTEQIHGALLAVGELLHNSGEFLVSRLKEACKIIMSHRSHRERLVCETVAQLLAQLAAFSPDAFARAYLDDAFNHVVASIKDGKITKSVGFRVLGAFCVAVGEQAEPRLPTVLTLILPELDPHLKTTAPGAALLCIGLLAQALGPRFAVFVSQQNLVDQMFATGLRTELVEALSQLAHCIPDLLPQIQQQLLQCLQDLLVPAQVAGRGANIDGSSGIVRQSVSAASSMLSLFSSSSNSSPSRPSIGGLPEYMYNVDPDMAVVALQTLGEFDFRPHSLLGLVRDHLFMYLEHPQDHIRNQAVVTCANLMLASGDYLFHDDNAPTPASSAAQSRSASDAGLEISKDIVEATSTIAAVGHAGVRQLASVRRSIISLPRVSESRPHADSDLKSSGAYAAISSRANPRVPSPAQQEEYRSVIFQVLERMITMSVADPNLQIRCTALRCLVPPFDQYLADCDNIQTLFVAMNDQQVPIRHLTIGIVGRLALRNPARIMPVLRKLLVELVTELEHGVDSKTRATSAQLLGALVDSGAAVVTPYVGPILQVLVPKLRDKDASVASCSLDTLGKLATIAGSSMAPHLSYLLPLTLRILRSKTSRVRRDIALRTLGKLVANTGDVVRPYVEYPELLPTLLQVFKAGHGLKSGGWLVRREALKVVGTLGALDPFRHKRQSRRSTSSHNDLNDSGDGPSDVVSSDVDIDVIVNERGEVIDIRQVQLHGRRGGAARQDGAGGATNGMASESGSTRAGMNTTTAKLQRGVGAGVIRRQHAGISNSGQIRVHQRRPSRALRMFGVPTAAAAIANAAHVQLRGDRGAAAAAAAAAATRDAHIRGRDAGRGGADGGAGGGAGGAAAGGAGGAINPSVVQLPSGLLMENISSMTPSMLESPDQYYAAIAIHALVRMMKEPVLSQYHAQVIQAIMFVMSNLHSECITFLPHIVPTFIEAARNSESAVRDILFLQLRALVKIAKADIRAYTPQLLRLVHESWGDMGILTNHIFALLQNISMAVGNELCVYLPELVPPLLRILQTDSSDSRLASMRVLQTIEIFGSSLADYTHLVLPSIIDVTIDITQPPALRAAAVYTLSLLCRFLNVTEHASHIMHALTHLLDTRGAVPLPISDPGLMFDIEVSSVIAQPSHEDYLRGGVGAGTGAGFGGHPNSSGLPGMMIDRKMAGLTSTVGSSGSNAAGDLSSSTTDSVSSPNSKKPSRLKSLKSFASLKSLKSLSSLSLTSSSSSLTGGSGSPATETAGASRGISNAEANTIRDETMHALCATAYSLEQRFVIYTSLVAKLLTRHRIKHEIYTRLVTKILRGEKLVPSDLGTPRPSLSTHAAAALSGGASLTESAGSSAGATGLGLTTISESGTPRMSLDVSLDMDAKATNASPRGRWGSLGGDEQPKKKSKVPVNQSNLKKAWEIATGSTKDEWMDWLRSFSVELLKESPSPALRTCSILAQKYPPLARELFNAAFVSCWVELHDKYQDSLVQSLEIALRAPNIPSDVLQILLNLAEYLEHDDKPLPIDGRQLGDLAERAHAYAKALHYKEEEFLGSPTAATIESLISINNQLQLPEAAVGTLTSAQQYHNVDVKASWFEKLQRWESALEAYERAQLAEPREIEYTLGRMRCLRALGEYERVLQLAQSLYAKPEERIRIAVAPLAADAAWHLRVDDNIIDEFVRKMPTGTLEGEFFRALLAVRRGAYDEASSSIEVCRSLLDAELSALVSESYDRAYRAVVKVQQLTELEEVISYKQCSSQVDRMRIRRMWTRRLMGAQHDVDVWKDLLMVRSCVLSPQDDIPTWLKFSSLCRKSGRMSMSRKVLGDLLSAEVSLETKGSSLDKTSAFTATEDVVSRALPQVQFAFYKHLWAAGFHSDAYRRLEKLTDTLQAAEPVSVVVDSSHSSATTTTNNNNNSGNGNGISNGSHRHLSVADKHLGVDSLPTLSPRRSVSSPRDRLSDATIAGIDGAASSQTPNAGLIDAWAADELASVQVLKAKCLLKLGDWHLAMHDELTDETIAKPLELMKSATRYASDSYRVWHSWAVMNFQAISMHKKKRDESKGAPAQEQFEQGVARHVVPAVEAFFRSISLARHGQGLQDILRLLTLWFEFGAHTGMETALRKGFNRVSVDTWLTVVPQIIARIDTPIVPVRRMIHELLCRIGHAHPQALVYPLTVASKSESKTRQIAATAIMESLKEHSAALVEQSLIVSRELIRVSILWHEMWHEALEDASRLWFGQRNADEMLAVMQPLHEMMDKGAETLREIAFVHRFGRDLHHARKWSDRFRKTRNESDLNEAWDLYCTVFRTINKQPSISSLELQLTSPSLLQAQDLELAVPGSYEVGAPIVRIACFQPSLKVIESKQHPRKLSIYGSDGKEYPFLLKGHEDLRQDERVMQLFGLVNTLLANDPETSKQDLLIRGYSVIPLAPNSGLIQWLERCDTVHALIKEYRDARKILINIEHRLMLQMAPDYQNMQAIQKIEAFDHAMDQTTGRDLYRVLWLKSRDSEVWLERRTNYTKSLASMSMVGYILGLGDRHPCNLMLDRSSGKIIHIDFGDCFEVAMNRDKFPEKVPFRLTRMLVNAMEVSGIEGNFRSTCNSVLRVLRENKESVMAVLEAFVYDPLINWRLLNTERTSVHGEAQEDGRIKNIHELAELDTETIGRSYAASPVGATAAVRRLRDDGTDSTTPGGIGSNHVLDGDDDDVDDDVKTEVLNEKAVEVLKRVEDKLRGRDRDHTEERIEPEEQVQRLIEQATSSANLAQLYIGWCPFW
jgi:phosphatidylinositol kinase/protein kinase (PI-3  family)